MRRERIEAEVEFKAKGLAQLQSKWLDFAGDLVEPVALLAAGATKVEAAWAGVRGMFLTRVLGPLGMVAGAAAGLLLTTRKLVGEWSQLGLRGAATLERMTLQFRPLLGSMSLARQRVKELFDFTAKTPFQLGESAAANKMLESLTRGALSTKEGMMLVGDAAAVAGAGFEETARYIGRLYDGLQSGRPVGEAAMRLQELGLITGQTRNAIESMQAANASGAEIWRVVEKELSRNKGAMDDLSASLEGLESTAADVRQQMEAGFGKGFMEGEKAGIKATTAAMERMTPVAEYFGEVFGVISNSGKKFKAWLVDSLTSLPGFAAGLKVAGMAALTLTAAVVAASGAAMGRFVAGILSATAASTQLARVSGGVAAAEGIETAVSSRLAAAKVQLAAAKAAVARGSTVEAVGATRAAAAHTVAALRTNTLAASQMILRGALTATAAGLRFVVGQLRVMAVAIATNPWMLLATALLSVGAVLLNLSISAKKAREELEAYQKATSATVSNLESQRRAVQSVTDLRKLEADVIRELAGAYRDLEKAGRDGDAEKLAAAQARVEALEREKAAARAVDPRNLRKSAGQVDLEDFLSEREREARLSRQDFEATGPNREAGLAARRLAERAARRAAAEDALRSEATLMENQAAVRRGAEDRTPELVRVQSRMTRVRDLRAKALEEHGAKSPLVTTADEVLAKLQREAAELTMGSRRDEAEMGLASDSELARLKTAVSVYDELKAAMAAAAAAEAGLAEATEDQRAGKEALLSQARAELAVMEQLGRLQGVPRTEAERQAAGRRIGKIEAKRADDLDPAAMERERQAAKQAEAELAAWRLDSARAVEAVRLKGLEAERAALAYEERKLALSRERGQISAEESRQGLALLGAKRAELEREAAQRRGMMQLAFEEMRLTRQADEARRDGRGADAAKLQAEADARGDRRRRAELIMEAREVTADPAAQARFADARLEEERAARAAERERAEAERADGRAGTRAGVGRGEAELRARGLRMKGRTAEARAEIEAAARAEDEVRQRERERELKGQGFGAAEAKSLAGRERKLGEADRMLAELGAAGGGRIVADSLAAVGGGGGVSGRDTEVELLRRLERVLEEIARNTGANQDEGVE